MKRKHYLLDLLNGVEDRFVMEALEEKAPARPVLHRKRMLLIAAIIALTLLLVGCVAVFLRLQDMSIGQATYTQKFDRQGKEIQPTEKTVELFTFFGHGGSPAQLAAREWYEFSKEYDPGMLTNESNLSEIPDLYEYNYDCLTREMVEKVDELAEKYGLKLLDTRFGIQTEQNDIAMDALGISGLFRSETKVDAGPVAGMIYPPSNFRFYISYTLTDPDALWTTPVSGTYFYSKKDYFPLPFYQSFEQEHIQQWDYTAPDGTKLLLALTDQGYGYIVADREDAIIGIQLSISLNTYLSEGLPVPTPQVLEQLADVFDYHIQPQVTDPAALQAKLEESNASLNAQDTAVAVTHSKFDDYFEAKAVELRDDAYCLYDINGDGREDLLISGEDGLIHTILTPLADGSILEHHPWPLRLLKNGGFADYTDQTLAQGEQFFIMEPYSETCSMLLKENGTSIELGETIWRIRREDDGWKKVTLLPNEYTTEQTPMTEEEVKAVLDAYPPMELSWQSATEYPLSTGETVSQLLQRMDAPLSDEELMAQYASQGAALIDNYHYKRFCLRDINSDGVKDLLLSSDDMADIDPISATYYWAAYTIRYGTLLKLDATNLYLCEDGVLEKYNWGPSQAGQGIQEEHEFFRLKDRERVTLDYLVYLRASDSWVRGEDHTPISHDEAQEILSRYPRIDQGMRPIGELMG